MEEACSVGASGNIREAIEQLPVVKTMSRDIARYGFLARLTNDRELQKGAMTLSNELNDIVDTIEGFYRILGVRNWAFSEFLDYRRMRSVLECQTAEESEEALIDYLKEDSVLDGMLARLSRFSDMRPRMNLLEKARIDFVEERYYSSVFVVVSVMDGFVNDIFKQERRGLHARTPEDMYEQNCFAAIWDGLPSIQEVFSKSVHKRIDEPIFDVMRHAIMHGMATNFDNEVVASKAWCMLFAIADWVGARTKARDEDVAKDPFDSGAKLSDVVRSAYRNAKTRKRLDKWEKRYVDIEVPQDEDLDLVQSCQDYLDAWKGSNYGRLAKFFPNYVDHTMGFMAGEARSLYSRYPINAYSIEEIVRPAPAIAVARIELFSNNERWTASVRWSKMNGKEPVADWEEGEWKIMRYAVDPFKNICDS